MICLIKSSIAGSALRSRSSVTESSSSISGTAGVSERLRPHPVNALQKGRFPLASARGLNCLVDLGSF